MTAAEVLGHALLQLADQDQATPCQSRRRDRWTSEDAAERAWAAAVCVGAGCPVLVQCGEAADEFKSAHHVWGGVDRTPPPARPKPTKQTTRPNCGAVA